jgi:hypothetical protein
MGEVAANFIASPLFPKWFEKFQYLLHHRNHTPEALSFLFETISGFLFPWAALKASGD